MSNYQAQAEVQTVEREGVPRRVALLGAAVFVTTTALTIYGADNRWEIAMVMAGIVASTIVIYGYLLPRKLAESSAGGTALILSSIAAVLLLPAFWSGLSLIFGAAGALLGYAGRKAQAGVGQSVAAMLLGLLASLGYGAIYVLDALLPAGAG